MKKTVLFSLALSISCSLFAEWVEVNVEYPVLINLEYVNVLKVQKGTEEHQDSFALIIEGNVNSKIIYSNKKNAAMAYTAFAKIIKEWDLKKKEKHYQQESKMRSDLLNNISFEYDNNIITKDALSNSKIETKDKADAWGGSHSEAGGIKIYNNLNEAPPGITLYQDLKSKVYYDVSELPASFRSRYSKNTEFYRAVTTMGTGDQ